MHDFNPSPENGSWDTHVLFFPNPDYVYIPVKWTEILMTSSQLMLTVNHPRIVITATSEMSAVLGRV